MSLNIRELLKVCAQLEDKVAELYYLFAELNDDRADLSELWRKTAREEENHQQQFQLAARLESSAGVSALVEPETARLALDLVTKVIERVRQNPPDWQSALKFAIELEGKLAQFHSDTAISFTDDAFNNLFKAMMSNDEQHIQSLQNYLAKCEGQRL